MSDLSFEQMLEESFKTIHNGEVVEGTVIDVKEDEIILNIGYKADGIITRSEYTNDSNADLRELVHTGDKMEAKVLKVNDGDGQVLLTYKRLAAEKGNKRLEEAFNTQEVLKAPVVQVLTGGLSVVVDEARVFIPASLVSDTYEKNLEKYAGQEIEFVITEFNPRRRRIIGDRKQLLVAKKAEMQKELFERIHVGDVVEGVVKNVTDFGAFIDLGGADGLLHISEMSWGHVENPKKVFMVGEKLNVLIKDINGEVISPMDIRLVRRISRDIRSRDTMPERTIAMWDNVVAGEDKYIRPYRLSADYTVNSIHIYEPCVLRRLVIPLLREIPEDNPCYRKARDLDARLMRFEPIDAELVPANSMLREFLGPKVENGTN